MKRREQVDQATRPPLWLRWYDPADWPDATCHPECAYWEAVTGWQRTHPNHDLELVGGPDTPWHPELL